MCLAVPMEISKIDGDVADVVLAGVTRQVRLELIDPTPEVGDYVIVHAGFAIQTLDREEAQQTLKLFQEGFNIDLGVAE